VSRAALPPGDHTLEITSSFDGTRQPFRLFVPEGIAPGEAPPLLIALHGKWVNHNAWFDYTPVKRVAQEKGFVVAAPLGRGDYFYRGAAEQDVLDILEFTLRETGADPARVGLIGHSMGGWGTWWIGLRNPDRFAGIAPMAAFEAPDALAPNALHLDPRIIHSDDDPVVAVDFSRRSAAKLAAAGVSFRYKEETGYEHASRMIGDHLPELLDWLAARRRPADPPRVRFATRGPARGHGQAWWVAILETAEYPRPAFIEAEKFESGRVFVRRAENARRLALRLDSVAKQERRPGVSSALVEFPGEQKISVSAGSGWAVFRQGEPDSWALEGILETLPRAESPVLLTLAPEDPLVTSPTLMTAAATRALLSEVSADLCLFNPDSFMFTGGPLTEEAALDLYVYPDESLVRFRYRGEAIPKYINIQPEFFPRGAYDSAARREWTVLAPLHLARRLNLPLEPVEGPLSEHLLRALRRNPALRP